jgi:hemoglobin/transferrin/lactoferrin receptor protein
MSKIGCTLLAYLVMMALHGQTLLIKSTNTNEPIEWATLTSKNPKAFTTTNAKGQADISAFVGSTQIEISSLGFTAIVRSYAELRQAGFVVLLIPSNLNLNEVVVSATRWNQKSNNVPLKIATITPREVALQNPQTAADLLAISGKVFIQKSQQGGGSPMIRGFATNRLLYTVDGVRMNTAIFRAGNIQNVINLDPFAIENTEVFFGPGSVIYGSDAVGGVMSFQTLVPELSLEDKPLVVGKAVARYSSANNEKTGHFDINIGWKKWALVTSFSSWDYDHLRQGNHGPEDYIKPFYVQRLDSVDRVVTQDDPLLQIPTAYTQINFMQKVRFKPNAHWDFQYGFHYSETSPYGRYDRHNRMRNGLPRYAEWDYGPQRWAMHNLNTTYTAQHGIFDQATLRLAYQNFQESRIDRSLNNNTRTTQVENVDAYSANLDFRKEIFRGNTLFYGAEYVLNQVTSTGFTTDISTNLDEPGASRYPNSDWKSLAVYVNDEYLITGKTTLVGGLRYNFFGLDADFSNNLPYFPLPFETASLSNGALTGSFGAVYRPSETWVLSTNFGTAFRAPNVDDIGKIFDSEPGTVTVPNPNLKAEYAYSIDAGLAKVFGKAVKLDLSAYYTRLNNAMVRRNYTLNGADSIMYSGELSQVQAIQNAAFATVYGVQAGLKINLQMGWWMSADVNWQLGEEELDDGIVSPSRHAAPFFGDARLGYTAGKLSMQLYALYQAERSFEGLAVEERSKDEIYAKDANGNNYAPAWYTLNVKAMYQITDLFSVSAGLENLTDQRYRPFSSGLSGAGRNFILSVKAVF